MNEVLNIAICEDNAQDAKLMLSLINNRASCDVFTNGEALLQSFVYGKYDIIFFDIYMTGIKGVEAAKIIRETDVDVVLVFTTTSTGYALDSYRLGALGYLEKPIHSEDVDRMLMLAEMQKKKRHTISLPVGNKQTDFPLNSILFFEAKKHAVEIHTLTGVFQTSQAIRLEDVELMLPQNEFHRCHRAYIVHLCHVNRIDRDFIMKNGERAYIRSSGIRESTEILKNYRLDMLQKDEG